MTGLSVRARLTLWHSAIVGLCLLGFTLAAYTFLGRVELLRTDRMLEEQSEILTNVVIAAGRVSLDAGIPDRPVLSVVHDLRTRSMRVTVTDSLGRVRVSTDMVHEGEGEREEESVLGPPIDSAEFLATLAVRDSAHPSFSLAGPEGGFRAHVRTFSVGGAPYTAVITEPLRDVHAVLDQARAAAFIAVPIALLLAGVGGSLLARRSLAPVLEMGVRASRIGAKNLHERLPVINPEDELGRLAAIFNAMLDRLDQAFEQQRRFMADASHELRTPVAIMRGEADVALSSTVRTPQEYRDALGIVRDASVRLSRTVNDLFLLARVDAGQLPIRAMPLYLDELVSECARAIRSLAQQRGIDVRVSTPNDVPYIGDEELLRRLVLNLLDNAIKYSPPGAKVALVLAAGGESYRLTVRDSGSGIPAEAQSHVFDRFFRADRARARVATGDGGGTGLGLSIALWIAEVHGGRLELVGSSPAGSTFELLLPLEPELRERPGA